RITTLAGEPTITRFQRIPAAPGLTLAVSKVLNAGLLSAFGVSDSSAMCFYSGDGKHLACAVGGGFDAKARTELEKALTEPGDAVHAAIANAHTNGTGAATIRIANADYQAWAQRAVLPGESGDAGYGYLMTTVSQGVSEQAGRTTRNLIAMWSIVAVVSLVGLGGWVARRVSDPLVELSEGARRIADGDFTTKVPVVGVNEVADLALTFNEMTDSLKDRSETLTKKVLELATLYEMSRALGSTLDLEELLGSVLDSALRIFDLDLGYVALRDRETGGLSIRAVRGAEAESQVTVPCVRRCPSGSCAKAARSSSIPTPPAARHRRSIP
ncbi:MAG: HAMP domain-containing protein, partial [Actinobacteria bacterium]